MTKKISISRPVNGISLNGDEFLLDNNNEVKTFDTEKEAQEFLLENGATHDELPSFNLVEHNEN